MNIKTLALILLTLSVFSIPLFAKSKVRLVTEKDKISYGIGLSIGNNFKQQSIEIAIDPLMQGIGDALSNEKPLMSEPEIKQTMDRFREQMSAKMKKQKDVLAQKNLKEGAEFLRKNGSQKGVITLPSGLQYKIVKKGRGKKPTLGDTVVTHYRGKLINGKEFDSSHKRGNPATFPVNGVIKGWTEALQLMETGAKWQLYVPSSLAYGERGAGAAIGPNATLIFDIELLEIK